MILAKKVMVSGLVMALFFLSSCKDRGAPTTPTTKGRILYSDNVVYGYTSDTNLNENGMYPVTNSSGIIIGWIDPDDHNVFNTNNEMLGNVPCAATTDDAYDENGFLIGTCNIGIASDTTTSDKPEYLCASSDSDPLCVANSNAYKFDGLSFSNKGPVTNAYEDGGLDTQGIISAGGIDISWEVRRTNDILLPLYTIKNSWREGSFTTNDDKIFPNHDADTETKFTLYSEGGDLVFKSSLSDKSTLNITELGVIEIVNQGTLLSIEHNKTRKEICFKAEKEVCIGYTMYLTVR